MHFPPCKTELQRCYPNTGARKPGNMRLRSRVSSGTKLSEYFTIIYGHATRTDRQRIVSFVFSSKSERKLSVNDYLILVRYKVIKFAI